MKETLVRVAEPALVPADPMTPATRRHARRNRDRPRRETIDDLDALLAALPPEIVGAVHALPDRER